MGKLQQNGELVNFDDGLLIFFEFHDGAISRNHGIYVDL